MNIDLPDGLYLYDPDDPHGPPICDSDWFWYGPGASALSVARNARPFRASETGALVIERNPPAWHGRLSANLTPVTAAEARAILAAAYARRALEMP